MTFNFNTLKDVNAAVNVLPYSSQVGDDWNPYTDNGFDCNNYASLKAEKLSAAGVPREAMRFVTAYIPGLPKGEDYHAALVVRMGDRDYVLDSRYPFPMDIEQLGYKWDNILVHDADGGTHWEQAVVK